MGPLTASVDPGDFQAVFDAHRLELPTWEAVATSIDEILRDLTRELCIPARVEARAKETGSLLGKVKRKGRTEIETFLDLAGARVVVPFAADVDAVVGAITSDDRFEIKNVDQKLPDPSTLEYRGVHIDLVLRERPAGLPSDEAAVSRPLYCEVQVKTFAQSLWAELSHLVTYKREVSDAVERRVRRLLALCEIIDEEIEGAMNAVKAEADMSGLVAETLERAYYGLTGRVYDRESSREFLDELLPSVRSEELDGYVESLNRFVAEHAETLKIILTDEPDERGIPLLTRPESLFIFERLTNAEMSFPVFWNDHFRPDVLERLKKVWGDPEAT